MIILTSPSEMHEWSRDIRGSRSVGFVPTMGALHTGHEVLLQQCKHENDFTVLSIFVNPTQFNVQSDFDAYPRNDQRDLQIAEHHGVDVVYLPSADTMYPEGWRIFVEPGTAADPLEGLGRPGHFRGVATVVTKLFNTVQPDRAYFGKKDYQQLAVIRQMVSELSFNISVVGVDTVRHDDGLAMSSRNVRLTAEHRSAAPIIRQSLVAADSFIASGETSAKAVQDHVTNILNTTPDCRVEYVEVVHTTDLSPVVEITSPIVICVAAWFGDVRLIDNIEILTNQR
jgi:pantoate--beta-alanine ligase